MDTGPATHHTSFEGLTIRSSPSVLVPRPWTALQSAWTAELSRTVSPGAVLELCSGAGHIGLLAALRSGRDLVQVDINPQACRDAEANATAAGLADRVEVVCTSLGQVSAWSRRFPLIVADPPYIASGAVHQFAEDPVLAIDGGPDGLDLARQCVRVFDALLTPDGLALLQLGGPSQVDALAIDRDSGLTVLETRRAGATRLVVLITRAHADD
jgi:release factor glutamine methyltransferase